MDEEPVRIAFSLEELMLEARRYKSSNALNSDEAGVLYDFIMELWELRRDIDGQR